jgi:hypothetical protein
MAPFDWKSTFLDSSPVSTPIYSNNDLTGKNLGTNTTNYATKMARLALNLTTLEITALKRRLPALTGLIDQLAGSGEAALGTYGYIDFLLQSASHRLNETISVSETLDDLYAGYAFGQSPPVFGYSVILLNNKQDLHAHKMFLIYRELLRAYALTHHRALCYMIYDGYAVSGYIRDFSWTLQAADESYVQGEFSLLVKGMQLLNQEQVQTAKSFTFSAQSPLVTPTPTQLVPSRQTASVAPPPPSAEVTVNAEAE